MQFWIRIKDDGSYSYKDAVEQAKDDEEDACASIRAFTLWSPGARVKRGGDALEKHHGHFRRCHQNG